MRVGVGEAERGRGAETVSTLSHEMLESGEGEGGAAEEGRGGSRGQGNAGERFQLGGMMEMCGVKLESRGDRARM